MPPQVEEYTCDEHLLSLEYLSKKFGRSVEPAAPGESPGLDDKVAAEILEKHGRNELPQPKTRHPILIFLLKFTDVFMLLLLLASGLSFVSYGLDQTQKVNYIIGIILAGVVVIYCYMTFHEEMKAAAAMASIQGMMAKSCTVVRGGSERTIDPALLVPGDVVRLRLGERVPADLRVVQTRDLKTEQSSITGEPDAVPATVAHQSPEPLQANNLLFASSLVVNGEGLGVVFRTGSGTMIASISALASGAAAVLQQTLLQREIMRLVRFMVAAAILVAVLFLAIGLGRKEPIASVIANGVIIALVVNVQQGLPATLNSCLGIAAARMASFNVLVRRTEIVETLGAVTVIASDKTGTLTMNKLTVENVWVDGLVLAARSVSGFIGQQLTASPEQHAAGTGPLATRQWEELAPLTRLMVAATACNTAVFGGGDAEEEKPEGEAAAEPQHGAASGGAAAAAGSSRGGGGGDGASSASHVVVSVPEDSAADATTPKRDGSQRPAAPRSSASFSGRGGGGGTTAADSPASPGAGGGSVRRTASYLQLLESAVPRRVLSFLVAHGLAANKPRSAGARQARGNPLDCALLTFADSLFPAEALRDSLGQVFVVPFNSANKWAGVVIPRPGGDPARQIALVKGGPEIIISRCSHRATSGAVEPIDPAFAAAFDAALLDFGSRGERVVGLAYRELPARTAAEYEADPDLFPMDGYTFLGLTAMIDPPRPAVPKAVEECRRAGIKVTMITGDHSVTAAAIARKVGILTLPTREDVAKDLGVPPSEVPLGDDRVKALVLTGHQLPALTDADWDAVLSKRELVFARTTPQQKLTLVQAYQARGEVIAMTGDGVNDSPALKKANVGIAMGSPGASEVAREASDIVLVDDDFSHIVEAVREGRVLYDNLKKAITYTYSHLLQELVPSFLYLAFGFPNALNALLVLSIDLVTEQGPAISLAYEPGEDGIMLRKPRDLKTERLVTVQSIFYAYGVAGVSSSLVCLLNYFMVFHSYGISPRMLAFSMDEGHFLPPPYVTVDGVTLAGASRRAVPDFASFDGRVYGAEQQYEIHRHAMSAWYLCVVLTQFWNLWMCRSRTASIATTGLFTNKVALVGTGFAILVMVGVIYIPAFHSHDAFQTATLHGYFWLPQFASLFFLFGYGETTKWFFRNRPDGIVSKLFRW